MNSAEKQRLISLAAMTGRLEGSADSLDLVVDNINEPDLGMVGVLIKRASTNLRNAVADLRAIYKREAGVQELEHDCCEKAPSRSKFAEQRSGG